jgi:hypothetical protein
MINEAPRPSPEQKRALEDAAAYIERWTSRMLEQAQNGPYFAGVRDGKLGTELRTQFRVLTAAVQAIYGMRMPRTVAMMTTVALGISPISDATADSWSSDLLPVSSWVTG